MFGRETTFNRQMRDMGGRGVDFPQPETVLFVCEHYRKGCKTQHPIEIDASRNLKKDGLRNAQHNLCPKHGPKAAHFVFVSDPAEIRKYNLPDQEPIRNLPEQFRAPK